LLSDFDIGLKNLAGEMSFAELLKSREDARNGKKTHKIAKTGVAPNARAHSHPNQDSKVTPISVPNDDRDVAPGKERASNCAPKQPPTEKRCDSSKAEQIGPLEIGTKTLRRFEFVYCRDLL
jgi:hypothetical protein